MKALREVIQHLGLDQRTCDFCLKCDLGYQERFDKAESSDREFFVRALADLNGDDFTQPLPVLGLITLLSESEFEDFIARLAKRAPFDASLAWDIIHLSSHGVGSWFFKRGMARFQRCFHLHPAIVPLLLQATIRPGNTVQDAVTLLDYFEPVAQEHSVLREALPDWHAELRRREQERLAHEEIEKADRLRREEARAARLLDLAAIELKGPAAMIQALADAPLSSHWDFPEAWAQISERSLRSLPQDLLEQALETTSNHSATRCSRSLNHKIRGALMTLSRAAAIAKLNASPLFERLSAACDSKWSLTYFPDSWAEEALSTTSSLPADLRARLLSRLMRLQRRSPWRNVRKQLLC